MTLSQVPAGSVVPPVLWTRGEGCAELAALLSDKEPLRVTGSLIEACISTRAEMLVSRKLPGNFDLASILVPDHFDAGVVETVVAAVAGGPNSEMAARVASRLQRSLGVKAFMACAFQDDASRDQAVLTIEALYDRVPDLEYRVVQAGSAEELVSQLPPGSALVLGAPGGNWFQRTIFGQGAKLRQRAEAGVVIVREAPLRVFHRMTDPVFVGPMREASEACRLHRQDVLAVVDRSKLIGLVHRSALLGAQPGVPVSTFIEEPRSIQIDALLSDADEHRGFFGTDPIPVVDSDNVLVGGLV